MPTFNLLRRRLRQEDGATAVEYAIMVALIAAVIIVAVVFVGRATNANYDCVGQSFSAAPGPYTC